MSEQPRLNNRAVSSARAVRTRDPKEGWTFCRLSASQCLTLKRVVKFRELPGWCGAHHLWARWHAPTQTRRYLHVTEEGGQVSLGRLGGARAGRDFKAVEAVEEQSTFPSG